VISIWGSHIQYTQNATTAATVRTSLRSWYFVRGRQKLEYFACACHIIDRFRRAFVVREGDPLAVLVADPLLENMGSRTELARGLIPNENKKSNAMVKPDALFGSELA
jgi:hypothetical protein